MKTFSFIEAYRTAIEIFLRWWIWFNFYFQQLNLDNTRRMIHRDKSERMTCWGSVALVRARGLRGRAVARKMWRMLTLSLAQNMGLKKVTQPSDLNWIFSLRPLSSQSGPRKAFWDHSVETLQFKHGKNWSMDILGDRPTGSLSRPLAIPRLSLMPSASQGVKEGDQVSYKISRA